MVSLFFASSTRTRSFWRIFSGCFDVVVVFFAFFFLSCNCSLLVSLVFFPCSSLWALFVLFLHSFLRGCVVSFPLYSDYETLSATVASKQFPFVAGESNSDLLLFFTLQIFVCFFFVFILLVKLYAIQYNFFVPFETFDCYKAGRK